MSRTPEQEMADEAVIAAIREAAKVYGFVGDADFIVDFAAVGVVSDMDGDTSYVLLDGSAPDHISRGLLSVGLSILGSNFERG